MARKFREPRVGQLTRQDKLLESDFRRHSSRGKGNKYSRNAVFRFFNIREQDYDALLAEQNGGCGICDRVPGPSERYLAVDHNHITGKIRGLLCYKCNWALGMFSDDASQFIRAAAYLRFPPANNVAINDPTMDWILSGEYFDPGKHGAIE